MKAMSLNLSTVNSHVKNAEYAVRGPILLAAQEIEERLKNDPGSLPFKRVLKCHIGNPQSLKQQPISFVRDVLTCVINPSMMERATFNPDVVERAKRYLEEIGSAGAYAESQGISAVRQEIADFHYQRDGYPADPRNIFLTNGASEGVKSFLQTIIRDPASGHRDAVLTPIPQYPLYSGTTAVLNGVLVPYYLNEEAGWTSTSKDLDAAYEGAVAEGVTPRALVVINPGNPTGQVMAEEVVREVAAWCRDRGVVLMADEVYQENVYKDGAKFTSFRKAAFDLDLFSGQDPLQMVSFHSVSKGFFGECGLRGGYYELLGIPDEVRMELYKLASMCLGSNTVGQIVTGVMVKPPQPGDASYEQYNRERSDILDSLKRRSLVMCEGLNSLTGVSCNVIEGAMYAFPTIRLPKKAVEAAKAAGKGPDTFYCLRLVHETGICVVPGSGFRQKEGTYHFRITILPPEDQIDEAVGLLRDFHEKFLNEYKD